LPPTQLYPKFYKSYSFFTSVCLQDIVSSVGRSILPREVRNIPRDDRAHGKWVKKPSGAKRSRLGSGRGKQRRQMQQPPQSPAVKFKKK
jgi:hypothetical protein